jgi:hypothetical protein
MGLYPGPNLPRDSHYPMILIHFRFPGHPVHKSRLIRHSSDSPRIRRHYFTAHPEVSRSAHRREKGIKCAAQRRFLISCKVCSRSGSPAPILTDSSPSHIAIAHRENQKSFGMDRHSFLAELFRLGVSSFRGDFPDVFGAASAMLIMVVVLLHDVLGAYAMEDPLRTPDGLAACEWTFRALVAMSMAAVTAGNIAGRFGEALLACWKNVISTIGGMPPIP